MKSKRLEEEIMELVIARLDTISPNKKISIGAYGEFGKEDLIEHVKKHDEIGKKIIDVELEFLRAQKEGLLPA